MALYDDTGFVSRHDAERAVEFARQYLDVIRADHSGNHWSERSIPLIA